MPSPLLSTYSTGENRVTASTMAVFERLDLGLVRELLAGATESGDELSAVVFENQITGPDSVPDARISARFNWWFETKIQRGAYASDGHGRSQLRSHATRLTGDPDGRLFVITPDPVKPAWFNALDGVDDANRQRVLWFSFRQLASQIQQITSEPGRLISEQTRFLLGELIGFYEAAGLLSLDDTVVVAARAAWPEYQKRSAYVCQPNRSFRDGLTHLGFYAAGAIQPLVPKILAHHRAVEFTIEEARLRRGSGDLVLADLIEALLQDGSRSAGASYDVLLLTAPDAPETMKLDRPIQNDTKTAGGGVWAWTLNQRYTNTEALRRAAVTSDLGGGATA